MAGRDDMTHVRGGIRPLSAWRRPSWGFNCRAYALKTGSNVPKSGPGGRIFGTHGTLTGSQCSAYDIVIAAKILKLWAKGAESEPGQGIEETQSVSADPHTEWPAGINMTLVCGRRCSPSLRGDVFGFFHVIMMLGRPMWPGPCTFLPGPSLWWWLLSVWELLGVQGCALGLESPPR